MTYSQFGEMVRSFTHGLWEKGLKKGDRIAILSNNRPEWVVADMSGFCMQAVIVPVYQTLPANQIQYILKDCEARAIIVENQLQYNKIRDIKKNLPKLEFVITFDELERGKTQVAKYTDILERGQKIKDKKKTQFNKSLKSLKPEEICTLVYTSGTTGDPKGVMLHHKGFIKDIVNSEKVLNLYPEDVFLSFLPLSHLYERLAGHWCPMYRGAAIHYARSIDTVVEDISIAKPTIMVSVPRLYEKVAAAVKEQIEHSSNFKRNLFFWALGTGLEYNKSIVGGKASNWLKRRYQFADKVVFSKIKKKLGGNFRIPIAGGAPLSVDTLKFFESIGLKIVEGYGMTETHLIITLTPYGKTKYGSCGKPIDGVDIKIAKDGEVLVKGDTVMKGYYNKPELTKEVIDKDGWLHTGDIGYLDEDKYLFLTDRKKNIIVTSGGKNVAPAPIEHLLKTSKYIDDICLVGNHRKFISAVVIPNFEMLKKYLDEKGTKIEDHGDIVQNKEVIDLINGEFSSLQTSLASYETVKKFLLLAEPLSIEKGELTPSLKIKRSVVEKHYKDQIDNLYG
ncbi:MAG: long-chain fatty acid--CoA ligase [Calditrichaceae bacterium]